MQALPVGAPLDLAAATEPIGEHDRVVGRGAGLGQDHSLPHAIDTG
jgi:hypothetical protein